MAEQAQETSLQEVNKNTRLGETDVQDCSLWHHLIFCQELENDDQKQALCWLCNEPASGSPAYKCLKCNFRQHKSCIDRPHGVDLEIEHKYWWKRHHLMLIAIDITINVVCSGCKETVFGPAYKCSIPECAFLLHKSCGELSNAIQHPIHPDHTLLLQEPSAGDDCSVCHKNCSGSFIYRCRLCSFNLDVVCASRWRTNADDCLKHALIPLRKGIRFTCESCGEEDMDGGYMCSECRVLIHGKCDLFPHTINTKTHDHSLVRTYSLICQVEKQDNVFCKLCYKKVKTEYAAYFCRKCGYVAHLQCAKEHQSSSGASNSVDYLTHLVHLVEGISLVEDQKVNPQEINHFSHPQHNLILSNEELMDDMRCEACMHLIFGTPFYVCVQCNFSLHNRCAKLPLKIKRRLFHEHSLTLLSKAPYKDGLFWCDACNRGRHGFTYICDECEWYNLDIQCCLIPETFKHEGHQHSLFLAVRSFETCNACGEKSDSNVIFVCTDCKFTLCIRCATLPLVGKYQYDTHLLKLSYRREDDSEEYYCLICEEERDRPDYWFYYCDKCKFTAHPRCIIEENHALSLEELT
jgi:hypothetical protein